MISLDQKPSELLDAAITQLVVALLQYKKKPYLPVWGELFTSLRNIAREGQQTQKDIQIYSMHPSGTLWYMYREQCFLADLPDPGITISLTQDQLIEAFIKGSFAPQGLNGAEPSP